MEHAKLLSIGETRELPEVIFDSITSFGQIASSLVVQHVDAAKEDDINSETMSVARVVLRGARSAVAEEQGFDTAEAVTTALGEIESALEVADGKLGAAGADDVDQVARDLQEKAFEALETAGKDLSRESTEESSASSFGQLAVSLAVRSAQAGSGAEETRLEKVGGRIQKVWFQISLAALAARMSAVRDKATNAVASAMALPSLIQAYCTASIQGLVLQAIVGLIDKHLNLRKLIETTARKIGMGAGAWAVDHVLKIIKVDPVNADLPLRTAANQIGFWAAHQAEGLIIRYAACEGKQMVHEISPRAATRIDLECPPDETDATKTKAREAMQSALDQWKQDAVPVATDSEAVQLAINNLALPAAAWAATEWAAGTAAKISGAYDVGIQGKLKEAQKEVFSFVENLSSTLTESAASSSAAGPALEGSA